MLTVTSPDDSGPGSFRWAIEQPFPRVIKFGVSGIITLESILYGNFGNCTIDGTGASVCLRGAPLRIQSPEWIIKNMRFRPGDLFANAAEGDGLSIAGRNKVYNVYVENCSLSWAQDETLSIWGGGEYTYRPHHITVINCIIAEGLSRGDNSYGVILGHCDNVSLINNVITHNRGRSPFVEDATGIELINNEIGFWSYEAVRVNGYCTMDIIDNRFKDNTDAVAPLQFAGDADGAVHTLGNQGLWYEPTKSGVQFPSDPVASSGAVELCDPLIYAGAMPRDKTDTRIVYNYRNGLQPIDGKWYIESQDEIGGWDDYLPPVGEPMTTQMFWYGTVVVEKPARIIPGGEASSTVFSKGMVIKFVEESGRWLRPINTTVWVAKDWLINIYTVNEEIDPPVDPPPVEPQIVPPDEALFRWKDAVGNVLVTQEYIKRA